MPPSNYSQHVPPARSHTAIVRYTTFARVHAEGLPVRESVVGQLKVVLAAVKSIYRGSDVAAKYLRSEMSLRN